MVGLFRHFCFEHNWGRAQTVELYAGYREAAEPIRRYMQDDGIAAPDRRKACTVIDRHCSGIWQAAHMAGLFRHFCFEHNWGRAQTVELYAVYRDEAEMMRVYLLDDAIAALDR